MGKRKVKNRKVKQTRSKTSKKSPSNYFSRGLKVLRRLTSKNKERLPLPNGFLERAHSGNFQKAVKEDMKLENIARMNITNFEKYYSPTENRNAVEAYANDNDNNTWTIVEKKGKKKTGTSKTRKTNTTRKTHRRQESPEANSEAAANSRAAKNIKTINVRDIMERVPMYKPQITSSYIIPHYDEFWKSILPNEIEVIEIKKAIQSMITHDIEMYSNDDIHVETPWSSGQIIQSILGNRFMLPLKNEPKFSERGMTFETKYDYNVSQILISIVAILISYINHKLYVSKKCDYVLMNKGGRVMQLYGIEHESFDMDLVLMPKSILRKKTMNNSKLLSDYNIKETKELSHRILDLIQWFCENVIHPDLLSILTPDDEKSTNKSIFKLSYRRQSRSISETRPLIDLAFTWKTDENNHSNTLQYFKRPIHKTYNVRGLSRNNIQLSFFYQSKEEYVSEKMYIQNKETRKMKDLESRMKTAQNSNKIELQKKLNYVDQTIRKIQSQRSKLT